MSHDARLDALNPHIRNLPPISGMRIDDAMHRLQWNENPLGFPDDLKEEALARLAKADWARYPLQLRPFALIDKLATHLDLPAARIVVSGGSSDMIRVVLGTILQAGDAVVMPSPTFSLYNNYVQMAGAHLHFVPMSPNDDFALPVDDLIVCAQTNEAKAIILCAPNNPTGTVHPLSALERLADEAGALLIVDAAYLEFSGQDLLPLLRERTNVIILRTFSKAFSMAGVRVGYALAAPEMIVELQKMVSTFPVSLFGEIVAEIALTHGDRFKGMVAEIVAERERLAAALAALPGVRVYSSGANFILVELQMPATLVSDHLQGTHKVLISQMGGYMNLDNFLRISVGTPAQNDLVIQGFAEMTAPQ